ncbi:MAG: hypothetical protein ACREER_03945, partial [Alphaproteobacteria bacterium]
MVALPVEPAEDAAPKCDLLARGLRVGHLEARLARGPADVDAVQALRYRVFYEEMTARPSAEMRLRL